MLAVRLAPADDGRAIVTFGSDSAASFECRRGRGFASQDAGFVPCSPPLDVAPGANFQVRAVDAAGNRDPNPAGVVIPPAEQGFGYLSLVPTFAGARAEARVSGEWSPGSDFQCRLDARDWAACSSDFLLPILDPGAHRLEVRQPFGGGTLATTAPMTWTVAPRQGDVAIAGLRLRETHERFELPRRPPAVYVRRMTRARDLPRACGADHRAGRRRCCTAVIATLAALACAAPAPASAAGEPQILAVGIDATDRFVVSWRLEPDTTFDFLEFATVAIANPFTPGTFAGKNIIASICALPARGCAAPPTLTAYRSPDPVSRDRRYFVKVNARKGDRGPLSSQVWVIDKEKPLLPGGGRPSATPTNATSIGQPYTPPASRTIPTPRLVLQSAPKRIGAVLRDGVRAHVTCPAFSCYAIIALTLGRTTLVFSDVTARPGERELFVLRPRPARRAALQRRTRARLQVSAEVHFPGGKRVTLAKRFTVRR